MLDIGQERARERESALGEGVLHDGVDWSAARRAHLREITTLRQAAERTCDRPGVPRDPDRAAQRAAARRRAEELRLELARIDAEHRAWLRAQGVDVPEPRARRPAGPESERSVR